MSLWLEERPVLSPIWGYKIKIVRTIEAFRSQYQDVAVYESEGFGKVLTLDGVIQLTEWDEANYHEMLVHVPLLSQSQPRRALVIGGGDGGVVREILRHPSIEEIHFCELDEAVVQTSIKHFPHVASGITDPKVKLVFRDGTQYAGEFKDYFDLIVVDSTDPEGPSVALFEEPFFRSCRDALTNTGVMTSQAESFNYPGEQKLLREMFSWLPRVFPCRGYYNAMVPTYPAGNMGLTFLSKETNPYMVKIDSSRIPQGLRYYTKDIHTASFAMPAFMAEILNVSRCEV